MDHTELTTGLYNKMAVEQNAYRTWLLDQIPGELLSHAYEYAVREDILAAVEELELSVPQAEALLASATPLADIYKTFCDRETAYLDVIRDCVEQRAAELLALRSAEHKRPLYRHDSFYARAHGELDQYRACQKANAACAQAIDAAIQAGFDGMYLNADVKGVLAEFGPERVTYVLAATIQRKSWDGRFSHSNQAWAAAVPMLWTRIAALPLPWKATPPCWTALSPWPGRRWTPCGSSRRNPPSRPSWRQSLPLADSLTNRKKGGSGKCPMCRSQRT